MVKEFRLSFRVSADDKAYLENKAKEEGFPTIAKYLRTIHTKNISQTPNMMYDFQDMRLTAKSFRCDESLWTKLTQKTRSPSAFIRRAIEKELQKLQDSSE